MVQAPPPLPTRSPQSSHSALTMPPGVLLTLGLLCDHPSAWNNLPRDSVVLNSLPIMSLYRQCLLLKLPHLLVLPCLLPPAAPVSLPRRHHLLVDYYTYLFFSH